MSLFVLKIGGGAGVDHEAVLTNLARRVTAGERWVLVHGCSAEADRLALEAGHPARTLTTRSGHTSRYTDARAILTFCTAAANVNRTLAEGLRSRGVTVAAFDAPGLVQAQRHEAIRAIVNGRPIVIRDDYSGSITGIDGQGLRDALARGTTPVIAPVACGTANEALNVDGDLVAAAVARELAADVLVILSNVPGLLRDVEDPTSLVPAIARTEIGRFEALAHGRMKKKLMAAAHAESATVVLADSRLSSPLDAALAGGGTHIGSGTRVTLAAPAADVSPTAGPGESAALEDTHAAGVYLKRDITIVRGQGARLWDDAGREYIDCVGGQGAANLGHSHPAVVAALHAQAEMLISCPELFHNPVRAQYQAALCQAAGMARVFLCNSGTEANEAALKFARLLTGRTEVVATMRGFHGRTMGALSATWEKAYREPFAPLVPGFTHVPYNNIERLAEAVTDRTAAVLLEVVQGEGGVHPAQPGYLPAVQQLCHERGALLIIDEVQTGFGRTGWLFAHQQDGIQPDMLCVAKSMAGGLPMGAVLLAEALGPLSPAAHGSTFGGNPLACAAGLAALRALTTGAANGRDGDLILRARALGEQALAYLREHLPASAVREVRGRGLMIGIELRGKVAPVLRALQARGVLALPAGATVLRLLPPLVIEEEAWRRALTTIVEVIAGGADD